MRFTSVAAALLLPSHAATQTSYPMITHVTPVAVQRGTTAEVTVEGQMNFFGAYQALFEGAGLSAQITTAWPARTAAQAPPPARVVKMKVTVAADAAPGAREFRLVTPLGVSSVGQIVVSEDPVVSESGDNNTRQSANPIKAPCTVCGRVEAAEDVDYFRFHAEAGQTLSFEVLGARLQDKIHDLQKHLDPMLTLFDADGRELAANDDFFFADPYLAHTFTKAGDYFIQVRDAKYDGDPRWAYALLVRDRPTVTHLYPMAAQAGQAVEVEPIGSARLVRDRVKLTAPATPGLHQIALDLGGVRTNPTTFLVSPLPQFQEVEPNDTIETSTRVTLPCGINGRIGKARDLDHFVFKATKGRAVRFEVKARRFGTPLQSHLDSFIEILTPKGAVLASNDDAFGKDAALVFTPPADGDYVLRVRDLNSKGGPTFVYHVEADWARPGFTLRCDGDKAMIGPGSRTAWYVHVTRLNGFAGPVKVGVKGLPPGVTVSPLTIPANMTQGVLVVSADAGAKLGAANVEVVGSGEATFDGKTETLTRTATPNQEIYFPGGGRGRFDVALHSVAVTEPSDILEVVIDRKEVTLRPGEEMKIEVTIKRRADFDQAVSLDVLLRHLGQVFGSPLPPGVTLVEGKSKTLLGTGDKGHIVLKAAADAAPAEDVPVAVLAQVSINFVVKVSYSSAPLLLSVRK
jgi:hypothetical protein